MSIGIVKSSDIVSPSAILSGEDPQTTVNKHMDIDKYEIAIDQDGHSETQNSEEAAKWREEGDVYTHISSYAIEKAVKRIKKSTGGGPQQITPWMLKQAIESSQNDSCSLAIAKLSNRMAKGDYDRVTGRAFSMMRSVALSKTKEKTFCKFDCYW